MDLLGSTCQVPIIQLGRISPPMSHFPAVCTLLSVQREWTPPWALLGPSPSPHLFLGGPLAPTAATVTAVAIPNYLCSSISQYYYYH